MTERAAQGSFAGPQGRDTAEAMPSRGDIAKRSRSSLLHGRRKGKKLGVGHVRRLRELAPALSFDASEPICDPAALFGGRAAPLWLEIGFGGAEHLASAAGLHPEVDFIGCESFLNGIAKALELIEARELCNIRLYDGDARDVIDALPAQSVGRAYLLFPDPWPKRRQHKRRFVTDGMLARLARILRPDAELRVATDSDDYAGWILSRILRSPDFTWTAATARDWQEPWDQWPGTRYEAKAKAEGRRPAYFTFSRRSC